MLSITTKIELPIAHSLQGAYTGLCVGNVARDGKTKFDLSTGLLPVIHGHNYVVTVKLIGKELNEDGMLIDFKLMKEKLHKFFDKYDHSMILQKDHPLVKVYEENYKVHGINLDDTRLYIWDQNPTAEYMAMIWKDALKALFCSFANIQDVAVSVEETSHNLVTV